MCPSKHALARPQAMITRRVLSLMRRKRSSRFCLAASAPVTPATATPPASRSDVGNPAAVTSSANFVPTFFAASFTASSNSPPLSSLIAKLIRTTADSFAKLTDAVRTSSSPSNSFLTLAAQPPQCIPCTSNITTSSKIPSPPVLADAKLGLPSCEPNEPSPSPPPSLMPPPAEPPLPDRALARPANAKEPIVPAPIPRLILRFKPSLRSPSFVEHVSLVAPHRGHRTRRDMTPRDAIPVFTSRGLVESLSGS